MKIEWDESISVGIPQLDEDHKRLIGILNFIENHKEDDVKSEPISLVVEQIREYASSHFRREEHYMRSIEYPGYDDHKQMHKKFMEKTAALCLDVMNRKKDTPKDIHQFLSLWVAEHILREDQRYKAFNQARQACESKTT